MRACVVSDTHGNLSRVMRFLSENRHLYDEIWHLGDYIKDIESIKAMVTCPVYGVKGNCDYYSSESEALIKVIDGVRVLLTHGHEFRVKSHLTNLFYYAKQENIDVVCFGHTHVPVNATEDGILFFNPGSASLPRAGFKNSVGIIEIARGKVAATHIYI